MVKEDRLDNLEEFVYIYEYPSDLEDIVLLEIKEEFEFIILMMQ